MTAILTSSWSALYAADKADQLDVQPVRISRGLPRFWPAARGFPYLEALAPERWMLGLEGERFRAAYLAKLDGIGVDAITAALDAIPGDKALACFEPFGGPPCHRHEFSRWYEAKAGDRIEEWAPEPALLQLDVQPAPVEGAERQ